MHILMLIKFVTSFFRTSGHVDMSMPIVPGRRACRQNLVTAARDTFHSEYRCRDVPNRQADAMRMHWKTCTGINIHWLFSCIERSPIFLHEGPRV